MKKDAGKKKERKAFKNKFLTDRKIARKKEQLRQFIDSHKVGLCVNNP